MRRGTTRLIGLIVALALVTTACVASTDPETTDPSGTKPPAGSGISPTPVLAANALVPFDACDSFLDYVVEQAVDLVGPYGFEDQWYYPVFGDFELAAEDAAAVEAPQASRTGGDGEYSTTNVQVEGVDEPDIVKTDGERVVVLNEGTLILVDVTGSEPVEVGRFNIGNYSIQGLFLHEDTVLLFGSAWSYHYPLVEADVEYAPTYQTPTVQLIEVDISGEPEMVRTMTIDGRYLSARMIGDSVRMVFTSGPVGFEWSYPKGSGVRAERKAIEENQEIIRNSTEENWIPYYVITDTDGDVTGEGVLFDCDRAAHPKEFSGINMLSVATIDLSEGLEVVDSTGVLATGDTIYSSAESLYVATQDWNTWRWGQGDGSEPEGITTEIHKFDISDPESTNYVASGRVRGYLLNQFSMDEHDGYLRVASTTRPVWWGERTDSESLVTVLEDDDGELNEVGTVAGLGETEQIYSVRFMGDIGYVVTFRQTDPLYTIDLSNPFNPKVVGELKILGYSAYLHPLSEELLMGVGQDATDTGRVQGTQVSVFDVSDPSDPTRIDQITLAEGSNSEVEYDHHAFLYWEPTGLTMIPVQQWRWDEKSESAFFGAIGIRVEDDGDLREIARIAHPGGDDDSWDYRAMIRRSIVIGDSVYTISSKGIMKSDLADLDEIDFLKF